jgi:hypothetical protein
MPQRSAVSQLPDAIRAELEQRLIAGGFADYDGLAAWLEKQGYEISRSSVHRYGQTFERRLASLKTATDQAKAISQASEDDEGAMNEALIRLVQTKTFEILVELENAEAGADLAKIGRMVAELARASISQKKWAEQARARMAAKFAELEADSGKVGLDAATLAHVKEAIYGIV